MIIILVIIGLILRLIAANQSLWLDEAISVNVAQNLNFKSIIFNFSPGDFHPPLFYSILRIFTLSFGSSELAVRLPSIIFGALTTYIAYLLTIKLYEKRTALIAATLIATSPLHIYYSQEARMYVPAAFFAILSLYYFISVIKQDKLIYWIGFVASTVLLFYTDYMPYFIIPAYFIFLALNRKIIRKSTIISSIPAFLLIFLLIMPWLFIFYKQLTLGLIVSKASPVWASIVGAASLKNLLLVVVKFIIGRISLINDGQYILVMLPIITFTLLLFLLHFLRLSRQRSILLIFLIVPILISYVFALYVPIFAYFRFIFLLPVFYIILASAINTINIAKITRGLLLVFLLINIICVAIYYLNPKFQREDWKSATNFVVKNSDTKTLVLFESNYTMSPFDYYNKNKVDAKGALKSWNPEKDGSLENLTELTKNKNKVYLFQYLSQITDPQGLVFKELNTAGFSNTDTHDFNGVGFIYEFKHF